MRDRKLALPIALVILGPAALLGGAFAFQFLGGLPPCEMCVWQRWPHGGAIVLGLLALQGRGTAARLFLLLAALAILVSGGIAIYHAGVEQQWWAGVTACSAAPAGGTTGDIIGAIMATPLVRCDQIPWELFGISLAGYNALFSLLLGGAILWLTLKRR